MNADTDAIDDDVSVGEVQIVEVGEEATEVAAEFGKGDDFEAGGLVGIVGEGRGGGGGGAHGV